MLSFTLGTTLFFYSCIENSKDPEPGENGLSALIEVETEPAGSNCPNGGIQFIAGQDVNDNGQLDASEIISNTFVCNASAANLIAQHTPEAPGENCAEGGSLIEMGNDSNANGTLETEEVEISYFVCNGSLGASNLVVATEEPAGINCSAGGIRLELGMDEDGDGTLSAAEISSTSFVCHGAATNGLSSLMLIEAEAAGDNCTGGGLAIHVGLDTNENGTLEDTEYVGATQYVCNGSNGQNPIMISQTDTSCPNGGLELTFGFDDNGDGNLVDGEDTILESITLCNGEDGLNSIITTTTLGTSCTNGGVLFEIGLDENGNNTLDTDEITASHSICNGEDGTSSLINLTPLSVGSASCVNGGVLIEIGIDSNGNGVLDTGEIDADQTQVICNGNSDGIHEFYFTQGIDGYSGVTETFIYNYEAPLTIDSLIAAYLSGGDLDYTFISLIRFEGLETIAEKITSDYEIVEATLYLYGSLAGTYYGNRIALSHIKYPEKDGILFQSDATWDYRSAEAVIPWPNSSSFSSEETEGTYDIFSMLLRSYGDTPFTGIIPLALDRSIVADWINGLNPGVSLSLMDDIVEGYELLYMNNSNYPDRYRRPTLYVKLKEISSAEARHRTQSQSEYQNWWQSLSYEEKTAPMLRR